MSQISYLLIVFLPLIGALIAGFGGKRLGDKNAQIVTCIPMVIAATLSAIAFFSHASSGAEFETQIVPLMSWITSGDFGVAWSLRFDALTLVMAIVVNLVSCLVHIYSVGYMSHDKSIPRFMAYLSLFTFFMLMLITSNNLIQLFFGWEGVGLASYLLIGFWYEKPSANAAAMKAFLVNRVGDFGFAIGIMAVFLLFQAVTFDEIFALAPSIADKNFMFLGYELHAMTVICLLLFMGAMGKSAQLGLHTWLPDAMEGPTPVSALIHAATMVTAGVFMVARLSPLFEYSPVALDVVCVVGATTAFFAATVAITQNDIKRVIAYSTCSQLGYMFFALGVSAYGAAVFHLFTHAFFKALLFLGAGSVIHALSDEQDMRRMGGVWKKIPYTYTLMWIGNLALAGMPFFAGYYSKDIILEAAFADHSAVGMYAFIMGILAAFLTAFYSWRLLFMTFHGKSRASESVMSHIHESPPVMLIPLIILAIGALFAGGYFYDVFVGDARTVFWGGALKIVGDDIIHHAHLVPMWVKKLPIFVGLAGILLAYYFYIVKPTIPTGISKKVPNLYMFSHKKWYFDELYDVVFVKTSKRLANLFWKVGDVKIIDGYGPNGVASATQELSKRASEVQTGYMYHYAFAILIAVVILMSWLVFGMSL